MNNENASGGDDLPLHPIATAPKDGKVILALDYLGHPHLVWGDERGFFDEGTGEYCQELKWWSPIPRPRV